MNRRPCASLWADTHYHLLARKSDVDNIGVCGNRTLQITSKEIIRMSCGIKRNLNQENKAIYYGQKEYNNSKGC